MYKILASVIVAVIIGILAYAATRPDTFHIQRTRAIQAEPQALFAILNDFRQTPNWSSCEKKDPAMKREFQGPERGKGSIYVFAGNNEVGAGRIEILESRPFEKITLRLDMHKPFKCSNVVEYMLEPKGDVTEVTWAMHGPMPFVSKVMCLFMDMDKMVGKDFEAGLASLKDMTEKRAAL